MRSLTPIPALLLASLVLLAPATGCLCSDPGGASTQASEDPPTPDAEVDTAVDPSEVPEPGEPPPPEPGSPQEALREFIEAQLRADWAATASYLTSSAMDEFDAASEEMIDDDLIALGIRYSEEDYGLESKSATSAIFFSRRVSLYLVMTREDGVWKVDPRATDRMNLVED